MKSPGKMNLQLTPLLDLLLIVIFAQYLEVQETQVAIESQAETAIQERDAAIEQISSLNEEIEQQKQHREIISELLTELFDVPMQDVETMIHQNRIPGRDQQAEIQRLKQRFEELASDSSGKVVEHLLTYEEMRKRCDIWTVHVSPDNFLNFSNEVKTLQLQIPLDISNDFVKKEFVDRFIEMVHTLPETKSLAIMLLTYDRRSQRWAVQGVRDSMAQVALRLNLESAGRTRFDYAELGFRIE